MVLSLKYVVFCFPTNMKVCCKTNICLMTSWLILSPLEVKYYANEKSQSHIVVHVLLWGVAFESTNSDEVLVDGF